MGEEREASSSTIGPLSSSTHQPQPCSAAAAPRSPQPPSWRRRPGAAGRGWITHSCGPTFGGQRPGRTPPSGARHPQLERMRSATRAKPGGLQPGPSAAISIRLAVSVGKRVGPGAHGSFMSAMEARLSWTCSAANRRGVAQGPGRWRRRVRRAAAPAASPLIETLHRPRGRSEGGEELRQEALEVRPASADGAGMPAALLPPARARLPGSDPAPTALPLGAWPPRSGGRSPIDQAPSPGPGTPLQPGSPQRLPVREGPESIGPLNLRRLPRRAIAAKGPRKVSCSGPCPGLRPPSMDEWPPTARGPVTEPIFTG